ncbi:hypothetical protein PUN4_10017 [Paraburkholderia unamae]|nr:hypothetical protein PUN4_10017 [Paraburkholderia unamae]
MHCRGGRWRRLRALSSTCQYLPCAERTVATISAADNERNLRHRMTMSHASKFVRFALTWFIQTHWRHMGGARGLGCVS